MHSGAVFKEYSYVGEHIRELDPGVSHPLALELYRKMRHKPRDPQYLEIDDLDQAIYAELIPEFWGGHIGTTGQCFMVNGKGWIPLPQPLDTPGPVEWYHRTVLGIPRQFPVEWLREGVNEIRFTAGPQSKYNFNWGWYFLYAFTIRIYYTPNRLSTVDRIPAPLRIIQENGETWFKDNPVFTLKSTDEAQGLIQVDLIGNYYGFDYQGINRFQGWHYAYEKGKLSRHIGSGEGPNYSLTWDTRLLPDQTGPVRIIPRYRYTNGFYCMGEVAEFWQHRRDKKLNMYPALSLPERFSVRAGQLKSCTFYLPELSATMQKAFIIIPSWSGSHCEEIRINNTVIAGPLGKEHDYSFDEVDIPLESLKQGENTFTIYSTTEHHGIEINLPGPALFILS